MSHRVSRRLSGPIVHAVELRIDCVEPAVDVLKALVDLLKALVDLLETLIDLLEALVHTRLHVLEALIDVLEAFVDPILQLDKPLLQYIEAREHLTIRPIPRGRGVRRGGLCAAGGSHRASGRSPQRPPRRGSPGRLREELWAWSGLMLGN
jgi:hypothetical protein